MRDSSVETAKPMMTSDSDSTASRITSTTVCMRWDIPARITVKGRASATAISAAASAMPIEVARMRPTKAEKTRA
ncbi:hypothetical protein [Rubellimicrobium thermophilum]|uniref:hypothetical protein n=1 Tax=Rubellimicrobium thermophilum TaxID=295419 RepID=UPI001B7F8328|nr:hypothetical protein [Rubellimicrobium thermophilum]